MSDVDYQKDIHEIERSIGRWASWWLRADRWPLVLLALLFMLSYFWVYRSPTVAMVALAYYDDFCLGSFLFGLLASGRGLQLLVRNYYESRLGVDSSACRTRRWFWPWLLLIAAGTCFMLWSRFPMHAAFLLSRPALNRIADEALADPANAHLLAGRWAGLYPISGVEVIGNTVVLYLGQDKGTYGFARVPRTKSDLIFNMPGDEDSPHYHKDFPKHHALKDREGKRIMDDWFVMYSSYWRVKVGWS